MSRLFFGAFVAIVAASAGAGAFYLWQKQQPAQTTPIAVSPDGSRYTGPLVDGLRQGEGRLEWPNGDVYEGRFDKGLLSGKGVLVFASGDRYEGEFKNGNYEGYGKAEYHTGTYTGEFKQGYASGQGVMEYKAGAKYEGELAFNQMHGKGRYQNKSGEVYKGDFVKDEFTGQGSYTLADKSRFEGRFVEWVADGPGSYTDERGNISEGVFKKGELNGEGRYTGKDGTRYEGHFRDWRYHGKGTLTHPNGDVYTGWFESGLYNGQGTLKYAKPKADGRTEDKGLWRWGSLDGGTQESEREAANIEAVLYNQNDLLSQALAGIAPSDPRKIDLYLLVVGGDGKQEVFRREAEFVRDQFDHDYGTKSRSVLLVNSRSSVKRTPLATMTSLRQALNGMAGRMDKDNDILFVYLTSHGSSKHEFSLQQEGMDFPDLPAKELGAILKQTGVKHKVIVISACYSGGFIDAVKDDNTLIITAARHDRRSFGCSDENDFTHFGRAFFKDALPQSESFTEAFRKAEQLVKAREKSEGQKSDTHSLPQMHSTPAIEAYLARWQKGLVKRLPAPNAPQISGGKD